MLLFKQLASILLLLIKTNSIIKLIIIELINKVNKVVKLKKLIINLIIIIIKLITHFAKLWDINFLLFCINMYTVFPLISAGPQISASL